MIKKLNKRGMTIIETIIALAILAITVTGACRILVATWRLADRATDQRIATQILQNRIEKLQLSEFDDLDMWAVDKLVVDDIGQPDVSGHYRLSTSIEHTYTNMVKITVGVEVLNRKTLEFTAGGDKLSIYLSDEQ